MKYFLLVLVCVCAAVCQSNGQKKLEAVWDDGLKFMGQDGAYKFGIGGRLHYDVVFLKHDKALDEPFGKASDKVEVRRARISVEGTVRDAYEYEFEVSFADEFEFNDMRLAFLKIPLLEKLNIGHFREPFGMEENTSSNDIPFMERSLTSAFGTSRNAGIMVQQHLFGDKLGVYAGAFRVTDDFGSDTEAAGKYSYSGRLAYSPLLDTTANSALHFGLGLNTQTLVGDSLEIESQNESNLAPGYISSGEIGDVERFWQVGGEAGVAAGKFTLQSEYMHAFAKLSEVTDQFINDELREFSSFYIIGTYFLSGGTRGYDIADNTFSDIQLNRPGAWEVALRYSQINLLDSPQEFRKMSDLSLGLNYYLSASTRLMANYIFSRIEEQHQARVLQFRLQVSF